MDKKLMVYGKIRLIPCGNGKFSKEIGDRWKRKRI